MTILVQQSSEVAAISLLILWGGLTFLMIKSSLTAVPGISITDSNISGLASAVQCLHENKVLS